MDSLSKNLSPHFYPLPQRERNPSPLSSPSRGEEPLTFILSLKGRGTPHLHPLPRGERVGVRGLSPIY